MNRSDTYWFLLGIGLTVVTTGCGSSDTPSSSTPTVLSEFIGSWQNTAVITNYWVINENSIINYGKSPPDPCGKQNVTILSETTFSFSEGTGAGEQVTMQIVNNQLVLQSPTIIATHSRINYSDIPESCTSL